MHSMHRYPPDTFLRNLAVSDLLLVRLPLSAFIIEWNAFRFKNKLYVECFFCALFMSLMHLEARRGC